MAPDSQLLEGKIAVVTGSGRGIGKTLALAFAQQGARVGLIARTAEEIEATKREIEALGGEAVAVPCDVTDSAQVNALAEQVQQSLGDVHVLVNNAGTSRFGSLKKMTDERFDLLIKVNLYGTFYCTRAFLPQLIANKGGKIINTSSVVALQGYPAMSAYSAAKAGVNRLTESAAAEFQRYNVQVNAVMPTYIDTPLLRSGLREGDEERFDIKKPERLIPYYTFLASKLSNRVTGSIFNMEHYWKIEDLIAAATPEQRAKWKTFREVLKDKLSTQAFNDVKRDRKLIGYLLEVL